jgi:hypothetical protein
MNYGEILAIIAVLGIVLLSCFLGAWRTPEEEILDEIELRKNKRTRFLSRFKK